MTRPADASGWRRIAAPLCGLILLALGGTSLLRESRQAWSGQGRETSPHAYPSLWLLGGPQVEPLAQLAAEIERRAPRGATILVATAHPEPQRHYVEMWMAWLLPRHRVVPERLGAPASDRPAYLLTHPPEAPRPDEDAMVRSPAGVLLRADPGSDTP